MSITQRLLSTLVTTGVPIFQEGVIRTHTPGKMTGLELAHQISKALEFQAKLTASIEQMNRALESGETVEERAARIRAEDADPKTAAESMGWYAIEDFAKLCNASDTGFRKRIDSCRGQIVMPHPVSKERLISGTNWRQYPDRSEHWGDWFAFADTWKEALERSRKGMY